MNKEKIYIFDTTLRDGAQTEGVDFSIEDKNKIANVLSDIGVDYIEGGWPGANPNDTKFFSNPPQLKKSIFTAFGMTKKTGRSADNDPGLASLMNANSPAVCVVGKTWDFHVKVALGIKNEENLENIKETAKHFVKNKKEFLFDAEHFFDGYKNNSTYALECLKQAYDEGARWIVLCDTNGGTLPSEIFNIVEEITKKFPGDKIGIHCHNDTENAVANSLAAIDAGARHLQGTINGLGERCGNANLISIIPTLLLKKEYSDKYEISINANKLSELKNLSRLVDDILNKHPNNHQPYVGENAFAHKGGLHVSAVMKDPTTYEHVNPELVGNNRKILVSNQAGRSNLLSRLKSIGMEIDSDDKRINTLLEIVKEREYMGYSYDGAGASFEILAKNILDQVPSFFSVENYEVTIAGSKDKSSLSKANIVLNVDERIINSTGEGNGPVNALDNALRKDLGIYNEYIQDLTLVDYKVRILDGGTEAITRVVIESSDSKNQSWFTVGISPNIIEASFEALMDSINYKLIKSDIK